MLSSFLIEFVLWDVFKLYDFRDFILWSRCILVYGLGERDLSFLFCLTTERIFYYLLFYNIDLSRDLVFDSVTTFLLNVVYKFPFLTTFCMFYLILYLLNIIFFWGCNDSFWLNKLSIPFNTKSASILNYFISF